MKIATVAFIISGLFVVHAQLTEKAQAAAKITTGMKIIEPKVNNNRSKFVSVKNPEILFEGDKSEWEKS